MRAPTQIIYSIVSNNSLHCLLLIPGYTTPAPGAFTQHGGGELSPRSGLQPPGGYSSLGGAGTDPGSAEKKKAAQQAYQEELKKQVKNNTVIKIV